MKKKNTEYKKTLPVEKSKMVLLKEYLSNTVYKK